MESLIQKLFLELLCAAIWNRPADSKMFESLDDSSWELISRSAIRQTTGALIADKILSLPQPCLPPINQVSSLLVQVKKAEEISSRMNQLIVQISGEYKAMGIPFALLKGQANAQNYPNPSLRAVGDLDLFLFNNIDYEKANDWFVRQNFLYPVDFAIDGHRAFLLNGLVVENHRYITFFDIDKYNKILQDVLNKIIETNSFEEIEINGTKLKILPTELNAFYIFLHLFFHFIHLGVSFRQFCDWILFLSKHHKRINPESFTNLAKAFNLLYAIQLFAGAAIKYLEAPKEIFPFPLIAENKYSEKIINEIWEGGSFGYYHLKNSKKLWRGRWNKYNKIVGRTLKLAGIAPSYFLLIPVMSAVDRIKLTFRAKS